MKKISFNDKTIKVHNISQDTLLKAMDVIRKFYAGTNSTRTLRNGKFKVLNVDSDTRVLIKDKVLHIMTHQFYNKFIDRL